LFKRLTITVGAKNISLLLLNNSILKDMGPTTVKPISMISEGTAKNKTMNVGK
jgi:hypothetical protein